MGDHTYPYFGRPPAREPRPAADEPSLVGKRVILSTAEGFVYDMRAVSQILTDGDGQQVVAIATEEEYYRWMFLGEHPTQVSYPIQLVWIE